MEAVKQEQVFMLDIERELAGPQKNLALARYDAILVKLHERLAGALREGLPPGEYARVRDLEEANTLARKLLRLAVREGGGAR